MHKRVQKGFTLIELLVVIAIIAIIAGVVVVALDPLERVRQSRDARRQQDLERVRQAIDLALTDGEIELMGNGSVVTGNSESGTTAITDNGSGWVKVTTVDGMTGLSKYIPVLPKDPLDNNPRCDGYEFATDGSYYELRTCFETTRMQALEGEDGGSDPDYWELGNDPGLDLLTSSGGGGGTDE